MLKKLGWCVFLVFLFNQQVFAQLPDFTEMVKVNGVAVVNISTTQKAKPEAADGAQKEIPMPEGMPPEMEELFKHFFNNPDGGGNGGGGRGGGWGGGGGGGGGGFGGGGGSFGGGGSSGSW